MKNNDRFNVECIDVSYEGLGICRVEDFVLFVENLMIGEVAEIEVFKLKKKYGFAKVIKHLKLSEQRVEPKCSKFFECGGCDISHMNEVAKNEFKLNVVKNAFVKKKLEVTIVDNLANVDLLEYRNKVVFPVGFENNLIISGPYKRNSHTISSTECLMLSVEGRNIHENIVTTLNKHQVSVYNKFSKQGCLRSIVYRSNNAGEFMITFVIFTKDKNLDEAITEISNIDNVVSIYKNLNKSTSSAIFGDKDIHCYGERKLEISLSDIKYSTSPQSFFQVNTNVADKMYQKIVDLANFNGSENVLDAYCGAGSISLYLSRHVNSVVGIDIVKDAINDANNNMKINNIQNTKFICEDISKAIKSIENKFDFIIIDPPRKGCSNEFLQFLIENKFEDIIYMSCNPTTLARDLKILSDNDYKYEEVYVYDMFPHTHHVETVVLLSRVK